MSYKNDSNYVSTWSWFWMMFVTAIPVIGWIMIFVWAFTGDNESRKNYYRAILLWLLLSVLLAGGFILVCLALGTGPVILKNINIHL